MSPSTVSKRTTGINLAGSAPAETAKASRLQSLIRRTSFIVLGVYLAAFLGVVGINFFFLSQEKKLVAFQDSLKKEIAGLSPIETLLEAVKNRTAVAGNLLVNSSQAPEKLLTEIINFMPTGASISEVNTQEGKFVISLIVPNSEGVAQLFNAIASSQFTNIVLDGLSLTTRGIYTVTLSVQ